jgi:hypothetical protein
LQEIAEADASDDEDYDESDGEIFDEDDMMGE